MSSKTTTKKTASKKTISKKASTPKPASKKPAPKQDHEVPSPKETTNNARLDAHAAKSAPKATTPRKPAKDATRANVGGNVGALKRPSGLDLAAKALAESKEPMTAKALADRVISAGWQTTGRTPEATLYSAIIREIANKGKDSRFVKASRGLFTARKGA